jgi:hypothetical protein
MCSSRLLLRFGLGTLLPLALVSILYAQKPPPPMRVWSVGPLTKGYSVTGIAIGAGGATLTAPHLDSQTGSIFTATRSVVFAGDRVVVALHTTAMPQPIYELLSLDAKTGEVKNVRELTNFGLRGIFATNDAHVIVSGSSVLRLTPDLKDDGNFDYYATGHKHGRVQNVAPDGSTLGNATSPGYELLDAQTLKPTLLTSDGVVDTSVNSMGFVTDNVHWIGDYPKDHSSVTYTDATGKHMLYHGNCGGRPQFLSNNLILEPGCKSPIIIDMHGNIVRTLHMKGAFSYAGVSQNGKRFALQLASFSGMHDLKQEHFAIYSVDTGEAIAEVTPYAPAEEQSWTAFSPDGSMFIVGSPLKLTLYRLP